MRMQSPHSPQRSVVASCVLMLKDVRMSAIFLSQADLHAELQVMICATELTYGHKHTQLLTSYKLRARTTELSTKRNNMSDTKQLNTRLIVQLKLQEYSVYD